MNRIHFLKTVWSDIILLESENHFAMIDTGYQHQLEQIKDYFKKLQIKELDFIIITHFHKDHYGSLEYLLDDYKIKTVYIKPYSGLDAFTSLGKIADDNYRHQEMEQYQHTITKIKEKSNLIEITPDIKSVSFCQFQIEFLNTQATIKNVFHDENSPYFHQYVVKENLNSCALLLTIHQQKIYLAGDLTDYEKDDERFSMANQKTASQIGKVAIYKSAHHGLDNCNHTNTLEILKPDITITTNYEAYIKDTSTYLERIRHINPDALVYSTEKQTIVLTITQNNITVQEENTPL